MGKQALCFVKNEEYELFNQGQQKELSATFVPREICETVEANYLQIIPYVVFYYMDFAEGKLNFFTYTRANSITEERLKGKLSLGVGGHIDSVSDIVCEHITVTAIGENDTAVSDVYHMTPIDLRDTVIRTAKREVQEELGNIAVLGKIEQYRDNIVVFNLDSSDVDKVHSCYMVPVQLTLEEMQDMLANENFDKSEIASVAVLPLNFKYLLEGFNFDKALNEMIAEINEKCNIEAWGSAGVYIISNMVFNLFKEISYEDLAKVLASKVEAQLAINKASASDETSAEDTSETPEVEAESAAPGSSDAVAHIQV